ncbi:Lrp/AsnC family transcriptional regulator [Arthrobacter woluwensis]|uniref:Lrp/AsnC family transcriptional regulator n=1 Tax=Arthrobacter woluwensis TaxID=156980 RepID=UPI001C970200|nr:Lrp/AsnC family transcriptional regulator [Arthrobacter woluwensis]
MIQLDDIDWQLLAALQEDARLGFRELGRMVHLTAPAVASRVRRLEEGGVILGYSARVDPAAVGYGVEGFIHIASNGRRQSYEIAAQAAAEPRVLEDHRVAGQSDHVLRIVAESLTSLEPFIDELNDNGRPATSVVFSSPKRWSPIPRPGTQG